MKRHTKPYGCTYPKCNKRFGAKSDWKRHENSQHFQLESYRCQEIPPNAENRCGELFYRAEPFRTHLATHYVSPDQFVEKLRLCRIGKNGQGRFWCGFCRDIIPLDKKRNEAWDERFDHIDAHFNKQKRRIEDWLCVEAKKTKGEVMRDMDRNVFDDDDDDTTSPDEVESVGEMNDVETAVRPGSVIGVTSTVLGKKRQAEGVDAAPPPSGKRKRKEVFRICVSAVLYVSIHA
jgi:hypothetical protein